LIYKYLYGIISTTKYYYNRKGVFMSDELKGIVDSMMPLLEERVTAAPSTFKLWFGDLSLISLDENGYIIAGEDCKTNIDGIFAVGDCRTKSVRQLTTAAADGAVAALA
jgi:hypothetical protein